MIRSATRTKALDFVVVKYDLMLARAEAIDLVTEKQDLTQGKGRVP